MTPRLRRRTAFVGAAAVFAWLLLLTPAPASAHPLGNFTVNRFSGIVLSPGGVEIRYVVDMAEIPTFQEMARIDVDGDGTASGAERQRWADGEARKLMGGLRLSVAGRQVSLRSEGQSMELRPGQAGLATLRMDARFSGRLPGSGTGEYRDMNYPGRLGWKEVTVSSATGIAVTRSTAPAVSPSAALSSYPKDLLSQPLDVSRALFSFAPGQAAGGPGGAADSGDRSSATGSPTNPGGVFASLVTRRGMSLPLLLVTLSLAFALGGLHALGPGHGKTVMAAYLVGAEGRMSSAVAVGAAISVMHTASVLALGLVTLYATRLFPPERVYPWLGLVSGVVVLALGTGLLVARSRARVRGEERHGHSHRPHPAHAVDSGETHQHVHGHRAISSEASPVRPVSRRGLAALALSGGILPSPTALVVLVAAIALHRVGYGLALIGAFSLGLATALVAIGMVALRARSLFTDRFGGRAAGWLGLASAGLILLAGAVLTARAVFQVV